MKHFGKITLSILLCLLLFTTTVLTGCQENTANRPDWLTDSDTTPSEAKSDNHQNNSNTENGGGSAPAEVTLDNGLVLSLKNGTYEVTDYTGTATTVVIPETYSGKSVTSIGEDAFGWCFDLTSVTIGSGVKRIEREAFRDCSSLTSVTFNNPNGWKAYSDTSFTATDLANSTTAAKYLKSTYSTQTWTRTDAVP